MTVSVPISENAGPFERRAYSTFANSAFDALGWLLFAVGLVCWWQARHEAIGPFDEGLLLVNPQLILKGLAPYRDFYANYPPGTFLLLAGLFKVFGASVLVERLLGLFVRVACGVLAGILGGRLTGGRFSALAMGFVTLWLSVAEAAPFAWICAFAVTLLAFVLFSFAKQKEARAPLLLCGAAFGAISWFRHDLFAYLSVLLAAFAIILAIYRRAWRAEIWRDWQWLVWVFSGAVLTVGIFWIPLFAIAGPAQALNDLYFDQARYMAPARALPMPGLLTLTYYHLPFPLPAVMLGIFEGIVALTLLGPVLALVLILMRPSSDPAWRFDAMLMGALSVAVLPEMLRRTDYEHAIFAAIPVLVLVAALAKRTFSSRRRGGRGIAVLACVFLLLAVAQLSVRASRFYVQKAVAEAFVPQPAAYPTVTQASGVPDALAASRREVLAFVREHTNSPREPIFVGVTDHSRVFVSEMDLYFLADRIGATRYMQFDPGIVTRLEVQQQMAREIEKSGARIIVLSSRFADVVEPNAQRIPGSDFLDKYIREKFEVAAEIAPYVLMVRRP